MKSSILTKRHHLNISKHCFLKVVKRFSFYTDVSSNHLAQSFLMGNSLWKMWLIRFVKIPAAQLQSAISNHLNLRSLSTIKDPFLIVSSKVSVFDLLERGASFVLCIHITSLELRNPLVNNFLRFGSMIVYFKKRIAEKLLDFTENYKLNLKLTFF